VADILITGATGFVGSYLVEALGRRGDRARALVRATSDVSLLERYGVEGVVGDIEDDDSLRRAVGDAGTVLHLAAATRALDEATFFRVNAEGTRRLANVLEAAGGNRRLVYLSSLAAVGPAGNRPVHPDDEPQPLTAYGRSKLEGEREVRARSALDTVVLRPSAVYGPRDRDLLPFFRLARRGILLTLGSKERRMQLVYAADVASAILAAADARGVEGVFHVAEPVAYRWSDMLGMVSEAVGRRGLRVPIPGGVVEAAATVSEAVGRVMRRPAIFDREKARELLASWECETDTARRELGFEASVPLAEGLRRTAAWYRSRGWL
jgi:nucleoside-diphosphate-sugar epimerase